MFVEIEDRCSFFVKVIAEKTGATHKEVVSSALILSMFVGKLNKEEQAAFEKALDRIKHENNNKPRT